MSLCFTVYLSNHLLLRIWYLLFQFDNFLISLLMFGLYNLFVLLNFHFIFFKIL